MHAGHLVDTNILIQAIRGTRARWDYLESLIITGGPLYCSVLTIGEVLSGMRPRERERTEELLGVMGCLSVTEPIARSAGALRNEWRQKGFQFGMVDMTIAATALAYGLPLVTENTKDFPMLAGSLLPEPPRVQ